MQNSDNKLEIKITCYFIQPVRIIITYCFAQEIPKKNIVSTASTA